MRASAIALSSAALFLYALATPDMGTAQGVRFIPQVGLYAPTSDIGAVTDSGISGAIDFGKKESTMAYSLGLELASRPSSLTFRANATYASQSEVPLDAVGCSTCGARSTLLALTGLLVIRPIPEIIFLQPYLLAGGGVKRYDWEFDGGVSLDDQTNATGHLGAGVELDLGGFRLVTEVSDYIDSFKALESGDSSLQNDLFFTVGVVIGGS